MKGLCSNVIMGSDRPSSLHGGAVLGVGFDKKIRPGAMTSFLPFLKKGPREQVVQKLKGFIGPSAC